MYLESSIKLPLPNKPPSSISPLPLCQRKKVIIKLCLPLPPYFFTAKFDNYYGAQCC